MEVRYASVRRKLDDLGYRQPFNVESLHLVDKLLNDLIQQGEQLKRTGIRCFPAFQECLHPPLHLKHLCKHENYASLVKENNDLQREIVKIKENNEKDRKVLATRLLTTENQNSDLHFLNGQHLLKIQQLENDSKLKSDKLQALQDKELQAVIQTTGNKKSFSFHRQSLKIDSLVPPSTDPPYVSNQPKADLLSHNRQQYVNMLQIADRRAARLQSEVNTLNISKKQAEELMSSLKRQVEVAKSENERLMRVIDLGKACNCICINATQDHSNHFVAHLKLEIDQLQRFNHDLEKQLKQAINANLEGQAKSSDLSVQNKQLELELNDIDKVAQALKKQKEELVTIADKEMAEAKLELEKYCFEINKLKGELTEMTKERDALSQNKNATTVDLTNCELREKAIKEKWEEAEQEKRVLQEKFNEVIMREQELKNQLIQQSNTLASKSVTVTPESHVHQVVQAIEKQRDYYKEMLEKLSRTSYEKASHVEPSTSTPISKHSGPAKLNIPDDPLIKLLEEERDLYKNECSKLKMMLGPEAINAHDADKILQLQKKVQHTIEEKEELNKTLDLLEKHVEELNHALEEMTCERNAWKNKYENVQQHLEKSEVLPSLKFTHEALDLYHAQRERDVAKAETQKASIELEDLHRRLKLATESQISERKRLEKRIADLETELLASSTERSELLTKISSYKVLVASMEDQLQVLQVRFTELQNEASQEKSNANNLRILAEQTEKSFKEAQRILSQKVSERGQVEQKTRNLEIRIEELNQVINKQNSELSALKRSVMALDREKDALQMDVDSKAERLAEFQKELINKNNEISDLRSGGGMLESRLDHLMEDLMDKEKESKNLERQIELARKETQAAVQSRDGCHCQLRQLQDDMLVMTNDHQALEYNLQQLQDERNQLKRQIQEYVAEIARIEELLRAKEQERTDLLEQFRSLTSTTSSLESHNSLLESEANNTRMELLAKETELRHSQDVIATLNQEIQNYLSQQNHTEQQVLNLQHSLNDSESQLQINRQECERLQREILSVREICVKLDGDKDKLMNELKSKDRELDKLGMLATDLQQHVESLNAQRMSEKAEVENLEHLLAANRQKEFITELQNRDLTDELNAIKTRLTKVEARLDEQLQNAARYRNRVAELEIEIDALKRQLANERFERERLNQELRRFRQFSPQEVRMPESVPGSAEGATRKDTTEVYTSATHVRPAIEMHVDEGLTVEYRRPAVMLTGASRLPTLVVNPPSENGNNTATQRFVHTQLSSTSYSHTETRQSQSNHQEKSSSTKKGQKD